MFFYNYLQRFPSTDFVFSKLSDDINMEYKMRYDMVHID